MKKVGIVIDRLNVGGVEKIAIEQVIGLCKAGLQADLIVLRRKGIVAEPFPELLKQVNIVYFDDRLPDFLTKTFDIPGFIFFSSFHLTYPFLIPFVVKKNEYDYFVVHSTYTAFTAIAIRLINGIHFSAFIWDPISYILEKVYKERFSSLKYGFFRSIAKIVDKLILHVADSILTGGTAHNQMFQNLRSDVTLLPIPPGVHVSRSGLTTSKKDYILLVTAWKEGKSPDFIVELLEKKPTLLFYLVGTWIDQNYKKKFLKHIKEKQFENNIKVIGGVSESKLQTYYKEAIVLLQINDDKGFGMPALEAAANGTTFIIPKGQGVCELFIDKVDGFYIQEKNSDEILVLLDFIYTHSDLACQMGISARKKVIQSYSWERHAHELVQVVHRFSTAR